jgi:hypothetical protein
MLLQVVIFCRIHRYCLWFHSDWVCVVLGVNLSPLANISICVVERIFFDKFITLGFSRMFGSSVCLCFSGLGLKNGHCLFVGMGCWCVYFYLFGFVVSVYRVYSCVSCSFDESQINFVGCFLLLVRNCYFLRVCSFDRGQINLIGCFPLLGKNCYLCFSYYFDGGYFPLIGKSYYFRLYDNFFYFWFVNSNNFSSTDSIHHH